MKNNNNKPPWNGFDYIMNAIISNCPKELLIHVKKLKWFVPYFKMLDLNFLYTKKIP
jgi:hypothetical protein